MKKGINLSILILFCSSLLCAQNFTIAHSGQTILKPEKLAEKFTDYQLVNLNFQDVKQSEDREPGQYSELKIADLFSKKVYYKKRNILAPDYKATISTPQGKIQIPAPETGNFIITDAQTDDQIGRLNISSGKVSGIFFLMGEQYYLKPLSEFVPEEATSGLYVLYRSENELADIPEISCAVEHIHYNQRAAPAVAEESTMAACSVIEVATESDYELFLKYSSNAGETLKRVVDQFNIVEGIYLNAGIPLSFALVYQNVWTTPSDPYIQGERFAMRNEFKAVWNDATNGFTDIHRDVAYMVSGKVGTNGGAAYGSTAGDQTNAYAVGQEFDSDTDQHLIAHEIGHTLSASHDTGSDCTDDKPTSGTMCSFVGTKGFSNNSVAEITTYVDNNSSFFTESTDRNIWVLTDITNIRSYVATATIILRGNVISPGEVRMIAGKTITLPVGFRAQSGSFFDAKINPNMDSCN